MPEENYLTRFEIKPGKWVFVPTQASAIAGKKISEDVSKKWQPPQHFYHFGKRGGHLGAMRAHSISKYRASLDLANFFGSVSRNKVAKSLKRIGFNQQSSFEIARASCVDFENRRFIPYGFTQSMILATLAVDQSRLGSVLRRMRSSSKFVSMFVDDLIISGDDKECLQDTFEELAQEIEASGFKIAQEKCTSPTTDIEVFNCNVSEGLILVTENRMAQFREQLLLSNDAGREAILRYISIINAKQAKSLE